MLKIVEDALLIYTDGSLKPKGRKGGYGIVFVHVDTVGEERVIHEHVPPGIRGTTGNRMELQACIDALRMAPDIDCFQTVSQVVIRTDSQYIVKHYLYALGSWRSRGWRNNQDRPVENADLWKDFVRVYRKIHMRVEIQKVKGHGRGRAKDPYNVRADKLAKESAMSPLSRHVYRSSVRRKISPTPTKRGSVKIYGQRFTIYIVEVKWEKVEKIWQYRYQVMSKDSPDYHNTDWIYSNEQMRDGHYYEVQVNDDMGYSQVLEVIREVDAKELTSMKG